jgi:hypothetical protein
MHRALALIFMLVTLGWAGGKAPKRNYRRRRLRRSLHQAQQPRASLCRRRGRRAGHNGEGRTGTSRQNRKDWPIPGQQLALANYGLVLSATAIPASR